MVITIPYKYVNLNAPVSHHGYPIVGVVLWNLAYSRVGFSVGNIGPDIFLTPFMFGLTGISIHLYLAHSYI